MRSEGERLMHKPFFLLSQLLLGLRNPLRPGTGIRGTVLDPSGRVRFAARASSAPALATVTGLDGRFEFARREPMPGGLWPRPAFETRTVELAAGAETRITLAVAGVAERIVVTATRHQTTVEEAGVAASVLTGADLAQRQYPAVADVLREVPGLQVTTTGRHGGLTSVFTRGAQRTGTLATGGRRTGQRSGR